MWEDHWHGVDPGMADAILRRLLGLTRRSELYWTCLGKKFRVAATGSWTFAVKTCEFKELPTLVAWKSGSALVIVCDQQTSHYPFSTLMFGLLNLLDRQLRPHDAARLVGEDGSSAEVRFEREVTSHLEQTQGEVTLNALTGAILRELWGR